jgi:hypothetical protein
MTALRFRKFAAGNLLDVTRLVDGHAHFVSIQVGSQVDGLAA